MLNIALGIAGLIALYFTLRVMIERNTVRLRREFQQSMEALAGQFEMRSTAGAQSATPVLKGSQETVAALAAATAVLGGRSFKVRLAKESPALSSRDSWAQHGRAGVWSAHDVAQRWR